MMAFRIIWTDIISLKNYLWTQALIATLHSMDRGRTNCHFPYWMRKTSKLDDAASKTICTCPPCTHLAYLGDIEFWIFYTCRLPTGIVSVFWDRLTGANGKIFSRKIYINWSLNFYAFVKIYVQNSIFRRTIVRATREIRYAILCITVSRASLENSFDVLR